MSKYTYEDIIINPNDPRLEGAIGKECYCGDNPTEILANANKKDLWGTLESVRKDSLNCFPFEVSFDNEKGRLYDCIILKKEKAPKYKPFDFSNEDVRISLRSKWVKKKDNTAEYDISLFAFNEDYREWLANGLTSADLLAQFTFLDGTPCGEPIEEDEA